MLSMRQRELIEGAVGEEADVGAVEAGGEPFGHPGQAVMISGEFAQAAAAAQFPGVVHWSTARSASAGTPDSPIHRPRKIRRHRGQNPAAGRGGPRAALPSPAPSWPRALRAIRAWLTPWIVPQRW